MKKTVFFTTLIFPMLILLPACLFGGGGSGDVIIAPSETDSEDIDRGRRTASGRNLCEDDNDCEDICEDVYDDANDEENDGKVESCKRLSYNIAIQFEKIMDALEEPYQSDLKNIRKYHHKAFFEFLNISIEPWVRSTESVSSSEAEALLVWVAREQRISNAIEEAYQNYEREFDKFEGMANLFKEVSPHFTLCSGDDKKCTEMFYAITKTAISGSQTSFWDIVLESLSPSAERISCEILNQYCDEISGTPHCNEADLTEYQDFFDMCNP